jgi:parallel beta-helix repeat protein
MKTKAIILFVMLQFIAIYAKAIYVSPNGSNTNSGQDSSHPYQTLQYAHDQMNAGDTSWVMGNPGMPYTNNHGDSPILIITKSHVAFIAKPGHSPKISFKSSAGITISGLKLSQADLDQGKAPHCITISGLEIEGLGRLGTVSRCSLQTPGNTCDTCDQTGIVVGDWSGGATDSITVTKNYVHHCGTGGIAVTGSDYVTISNNIVDSCASWGIMGGSGIGIGRMDNERMGRDTVNCRNKIINNVSYNNDNKIKWYFVNAITDGNGFIYDCPVRDGVSGFTGPYKGRTLIAHNLLVNNGGSGCHLLGADKVDILYNIAINNERVVDSISTPDILAAWNDKDANIVGNIMVCRGGNASKLKKNLDIGPTGGKNIYYDFNVYATAANNVQVTGYNDIAYNSPFQTINSMPSWPVLNPSCPYYNQLNNLILQVHLIHLV